MEALDPLVLPAAVVAIQGLVRAFGATDGHCQSPLREPELLCEHELESRPVRRARFARQACLPRFQTVPTERPDQEKAM